MGEFGPNLMKMLLALCHMTHVLAPTFIEFARMQWTHAMDTCNMEQDG